MVDYFTTYWTIDGKYLLKDQGSCKSFVQSYITMHNITLTVF